MYKKTKESSLMGHTEVRFTQEGSEFQIVASFKGLEFRGVSEQVTSHAELEELAKVISDAWAAYHKMKVQITTDATQLTLFEGTH